MFSAGDDDDGDFLAPSGGSKLASLFGSTGAQPSSNEKLTYTAPKEPKKKKEGAAGSSTPPAVLHAVAVTAYKYVDGQYTSVGKLGAAILGNHANKDYKLLLYVSKQQQVTFAMINSTFNFVMQPNNYASFYDEARQSYSLLFDSESAAIQFAKQIAITKANCYGGSLTDVVRQDLVGGEGSPLQVGDSAEVKYTGWLFSDHNFGQEFDSNAGAEKLFRFKLGKGKIIKGWEDGMLGMKKGGRRVIIVPPHLAYGAKGAGNKVPPDATLIFDVEVVRVKIVSERDSPESSTSSVATEPQLPPPQPEPARPPAAPSGDDLDSDDDNASVKERTRSFTEQLEKSSPASGKAKLISRMAKMGKPMLPMTGAVPVQPDSDSDSQEISASPPSPKPMLPPKPGAHVASAAAPQPAVIPDQPVPQQPVMMSGAMNQPQMAAPHVMPPQYPTTAAQQPNPAVFQGVSLPSHMAVYQAPHPGGMMPGMAGQPPYQFAHSNQQVFPQQYAAQVPTTQPMTSDFPVLMSETRQNNTEVRLSISQVSDKIDRLAEKLDQWNREKNMSVMSSSSPNMETAVLMHNVQRIVSENERLKKELYEKSSRVETQNEKIAELLKQNQRYVEQSHSFLEERNDAFKSTAANSQARVLSLEQEKVKLVTELGDAMSQIGNLQLEINSFRKNETEIRHKMESTLSINQKYTEELASLKNKLIDYESQVEQLTVSQKEDRQQRKQLEIKHSTLEEDMADLKATNKNLEKNLTEKKKKSAEEKKRLEEELEETKAHHEKDVTKLKDSLRKQRSNTDAATATQVTELEAELNKEWQEKCDRMVAAANDKHQRAIKDMQEEKAQLEAKVKELESKFTKLKSARTEGDKEVIQLQEEVDEMKAWKDKFETLKTQATSMKQRYEDHIREVEGERDQAMKERNLAVDKARQAMAASGATTAAAPAGGDKEATAAEVKKIMNSVFHQLKAEFTANKSYKGTDIHSTIMETIKDVTLKMTREQKEDSSVQAQLEAMICPSGAPTTGDRGNPYYAAELDKNRSKDDVIMPNVAPVTGDKGNPYYSAELEGKTYKPDPIPSGMSALEASIIPSGTQPKEVSTSSALSALEASIIPDTGTGKDSKSALESSTIPATSSSKKSGGFSPLEASIIPDTSSSKQKGGAPMFEASIIPNTSSKKPASGSSSPGKSGAASFEASITPAPNTGGRGNPYYDAELRKKDKKDVIMPEPAPNTGDKGSPYYAAHLEGKTVSDKSSPKSSGGSDFLSKLESSIIPEGQTDKKSGKKPSDKPDVVSSTDSKSKSAGAAPKSDFLSGLESQIVVDSGASKDKGKATPDVVGAKDPKKAKTEKKAGDKK